MHDFRRLLVWRKARWLVREIYRVTDQLPSTERFGLTQQMRRAAVSIPSNIAEGAGRATEKDFKRFLRVAAGSASELQTQIVLAADLGFIDDTTARHSDAAITEVKRMLHTMTR